MLKRSPEGFPMNFRSLLLAGLALTGLAPQAATAALSVGAARLDITPDPKSLPRGYEGVNDPIFVRAIVIDDGKTRAALVTVDAGAVSSDTFAQVSQQAERELRIPVRHMLLTATHTHSVPFGGGRDLAPRIVSTISQAAGKLQPARMAYGTGVSYINVNRNIIDAQTHRWWEGPNYEGVSDKTVAVVRFESLDKKPIAVYYNYAVHAVLTGQLDQISADIPGAASRYIEDSLDDQAVAVWSTGASGDQNPIYFQQTYDLREIRIKHFAAQGKDISNAMPPGGQGLNKRDPKVAKLMSQQRQMSASMGQMLGEEVLHVMRSNLERPATAATIVGAQKTVTCPGRKRTDTGRAGYPGTYVDADPIPIQLSLVRLGNVAIAGVNAEVFTTIAQRLKAQSPLKQTMMATLTNGSAPSGYIPNDAAFGYNTFEVVSSRLKPGCAETAIVDGLLDLIDEAGTR
jgi:neutral ceramidase